MAGIGIVLAIALAAAALVVALVRQPDAPSVAATPIAATTVGDTSAADKALCEKVAPLMREVLDEGHRFVALGDPGTAARDAGIPAYRTEIDDWAGRIQPIVDENASPDRYLTRTLQNFVDLNRLYAGNIRPGPEKSTDTEAWDAGSIAFGGPWETCRAIGVPW